MKGNRILNGFDLLDIALEAPDSVKRSSTEDLEKWVREKLKSIFEANLILDYTEKCVREGEKIGRTDMLEELLADAEECEIEWYDGMFPNFTQEQFHTLIDKAEARCGEKINIGDKIKILILCNS